MSTAKRKTSGAKAAAPAAPAETITAYKGFSSDWRCCDFQFAVGQIYDHSGPVVACESGFHSCLNPLDVFSYYDPAHSVFAEVEASGEIQRHADDSKIASGRISIKAAISVPDLVGRAVAWILSHIDKTLEQTNTGDSSAATNTGDSSAATNTGNRSAATNTGTRSAATNTGISSAATNTGYSSAATNTGYSSAATNTGYSSAATNTGTRSAATNTGYSSAATNTGTRSAATNTGDSSAATNTGYSSAATNTGYSSAATNTGYSSAATNTGYSSAAEITARSDGKPQQSVAIATGYASRARAPLGSAIVIVERDDDWNIVNIRATKIGENGTEANVWYVLTGGQFVKADAS